MIVRPMAAADYESVSRIWNACVEAEEVLYFPLTEDYFQRKFGGGQGQSLLVAEENGRVVGALHGVCSIDKPGEAYLTFLMADPACRRQGVGHALLSAFRERARGQGAASISISNLNPVSMDWRIPGAPGHDHNNMPGADLDAPGYGFLLREGFVPLEGNVAMYKTLQDYRLPENIEPMRQKLLDEGIYTGPYDAKWNCGFDLMCDHLGGAYYWRDVLKTEIRAWQEGTPNRDPRMWADGVPPQGPRTLLTAVHDGQIVGFTGPVDLQKSGRGWFCGICVDPGYERRGIATVLFHLLLESFVSKNAQFCTLFTGFENHAQKIYLRAGLRPVRSFRLMSLPLP